MIFISIIEWLLGLLAALVVICCFILWWLFCVAIQITLVIVAFTIEWVEHHYK